MKKGPARFIENLLRGRRPPRFRADAADAGMLRAAIDLRAARPESGAPREEFVADLHRKLLAERHRQEEPLPRPAPRTRRLVLGGAALTATGLAAGVGLDSAARSGHQSGGETLAPDSGVWHSVADVGELAEGVTKAFDTGTYSGFVTRTDGRLRAVSGVCTHQGCKLSAAAGGLRCPCHGAVFALDGTPRIHPRSTTLPALPRLALRVQGGIVQVYVPA